MTTENALRRLARWASEWWTTLRIAPPFSRRRRELLAILRDDNPDNWVDVHDPRIRPAAPSKDCPHILPPDSTSGGWCPEHGWAHKNSRFRPAEDAP